GVQEKIGTLNDEVIVQIGPDTGVFNAILNAFVIGGHMERAECLIGEIGLFGVRPDVLTYNIMVKLYARAEREELLVGVLERYWGKISNPAVLPSIL
ncbi:hypothetical protein KI387_028622, partial [Taxus chinensis]